MTRLLTALLLVLPLWSADAAPDTAKPKPYPLATCIVTGEKLDSMGGAATFVHEGQEIKVCCKGCIRSFKKDPATHLKKLTPVKDAPAKP